MPRVQSKKLQPSVFGNTFQECMFTVAASKNNCIQPSKSEHFTTGVIHIRNVDTASSLMREGEGGVTHTSLLSSVAVTLWTFLLFCPLNENPFL